MDNFNELLIPALVAFVSWFVKDFIVELISKRNDITRREWEYRLKEVLCPLYFWSGVITFDNKSPDGMRHGTAELGSALAKSAYVVPMKFYHTLVKLVELAYKQETTLPTDDQVLALREYLFGQIVLLNYVLYRRSEYGDIMASTDLRYQYRYILRVILVATTHVLIWLGISVLLGALYWSFANGIFWPLMLFGFFVLVLFIVDYNKRKDIRAKMQEYID